VDSIESRGLNRKPDVIKSYFKNVGDSIVTTKNIKVIFPERFVKTELAFMGSTIRLVGLYSILDEQGNYGVVIAPIFQDLSPYNVGEVAIDDNVYKVLYFNAGDVFMLSKTLVMADEFMYDIFSEFFLKGNIPWYLNYEDVSNVFLESKKYANSNIGNNPLTMEILTSVIARDRENKDIRIREMIITNTDKNKIIPSYIGLNNIYYSFDNTGARLIGGYYGDSVVNAIVSPETKSTTVADLLRA
jgi:hypothetical protein